MEFYQLLQSRCGTSTLKLTSYLWDGFIFFIWKFMMLWTGLFQLTVLGFSKGLWKVELKWCKLSIGLHCWFLANLIQLHCTRSLGKRRYRCLGERCSSVLWLDHTLSLSYGFAFFGRMSTEEWLVKLGVHIDGLCCFCGAVETLNH